MKIILLSIYLFHLLAKQQNAYLQKGDILLFHTFLYAELPQPKNAIEKFDLNRFNVEIAESLPGLNSIG